MSHLDEGQLHELLDGELDEAARAAAMAHLATCERCKAAYDEAASFLAEADALIDAVQLPAAAVALAAAAPAAAPVAEVTVREIGSAARMRRYRTLAWAASIVVAVGIGWYGSNSFRPALEQGATSAVLRDEASPVGAPAVPPAQPMAATPAPALSAEADRAAKPGTDLARQAPRRDRTLGQDKAAPEDVLNAAATQSTAGAAAASEPKQAAENVLAERSATTQAAPAPPAPAPAASALAPLELRRKEQGQTRISASDAAVTGKVAGLASKAMPSTFRVVQMEEAVRILGGSIRLIDGMTPSRMLAGRISAGSDAGVVRVVYQDPPGRELWLDQQRQSDGDVRANSATALLFGDTLIVTKDQGARSLDWIDQTGFLLRLTAFLPADSLLQLRARVR